MIQSHRIRTTANAHETLEQHVSKSRSQYYILSIYYFTAIVSNMPSRCPTVFQTIQLAAVAISPFAS